MSPGSHVIKIAPDRGRPVVCVHCSVVCVHRPVVCVHCSVVCVHRPVVCVRRFVVCVRRSVVCVRRFVVCVRRSVVCVRRFVVCVRRSVVCVRRFVVCVRRSDGLTHEQPFRRGPHRRCRAGGRTKPHAGASPLRDSAGISPASLRAAPLRPGTGALQTLWAARSDRQASITEYLCSQRAIMAWQPSAIIGCVHLVPVDLSHRVIDGEAVCAAL